MRAPQYRSHQPHPWAARALAACGVLLLACPASGSSERDDVTGRLELLHHIRDVHREQENTGFVFVMSHRGERVLEDFAGLAVIEHDVPMRADAVFPIMSITKAFTGAALAMAVHEQRVDLDAPVSRYLPDYAGEGADIITPRMLAAHTSGIPHTGHPDRKALYVERFTSAGGAVSAFADRALISAPGAEYHYSSSGYNLIAAVIEAASGMPFRDYVRTRVIEPLGLGATAFDDVMKPIPRKVRNYSYVDIWTYAPVDTLQEVPTWDFSYNDGGGNMVSTAADLLRYGEALLANHGLPAPALERLSAPAAVEPDLSPWSLGWILGEDDRGRRTIHITGATPGVQAALYVYPDHDLVFAMLANCWGRNSAGGDLVIGAPQRLVDAYLRQASPD